MNFLELCAVVGFALLIVFASWQATRQKDRRNDGMKALAERLGLRFLGDDLPHDLPLSAMDTRSSWDEAEGCVSGVLDGVRVVAFHFRVGVGKQRHGETLIAAQSGKRLQPGKLKVAGYSMQVFRDGDWLLATCGLLRAESIEAVWLALR